MQHTGWIIPVKALLGHVQSTKQATFQLPCKQRVFHSLQRSIESLPHTTGTQHRPSLGWSGRSGWDPHTIITGCRRQILRSTRVVGGQQPPLELWGDKWFHWRNLEAPTWYCRLSNGRGRRQLPSTQAVTLGMSAVSPSSNLADTCQRKMASRWWELNQLYWSQ